MVSMWTVQIHPQGSAKNSDDVTEVPTWMSPYSGNGVSGNSRGVAGFVYFATRLLFKWLNRRSQRRSMNWKRFGRVIRPLLPAARIVHDLYPIPWWMAQTGRRMV